MLEKILKELNENKNVFAIQGHVGYFVPLKVANDIIRNNIDDGWIPCSEREPEVDADMEEIIEDDDCPEYNVTIKGATEATTLKYSPDGTWFDANGYVYDVIAWQPLPEAYRQEKGAEI